MAESQQHDIPDASESWYREREARIQADRDRVGAQKIALENAYSHVEAQWRQLDQQQETAHDELDTRALIDIERQRARLSSDISQLQEGYATLQQQEQQLERAGKLDYATLVENSSDKSKLFLEVFKSKLQHDPAACRRLLHADAIVRASNVPVDSNNYFVELERHMGFSPEERKFTFEDDYTTADKPNEAKRSGDKSKSEFQLSPEQRAFVKNLNGVTEAEYAAACANPFSKAAISVDADPVDFGAGQGSKGMEVSLDEDTPARKPVPQGKYKPGPNAVTLSRAQVKFCQDSGIDVKDYVRQKLAVDSGKTNHQWYEARLKSQGLA